MSDIERVYTIYRFYAPHTGRERQVVMKGLTLEEAQEHCSRDCTHVKGEWFDGYIREE